MYDASWNGVTKMEFVDRLLTCRDCRTTFVFTAEEQAFFQEKEFKHDPGRCKLCAAKRRHQRQKPHDEARVNCAECGVETTVPFKPRNGKPVYCYTCFKKANQMPVSRELAISMSREATPYAA